MTCHGVPNTTYPWSVYLVSLGDALTTAALQTVLVTMVSFFLSLKYEHMDALQKFEKT